MKATDGLRIWWGSARYDFWLDIEGVPARSRRDLRRELRANLTEAADYVGAGRALVNVGGMRALAAEATLDGAPRAAWTAGLTAGFASFALLAVLFLFAAGYYTEGVLDAGAAEPVSSGLFPFPGSAVEVHDRGPAGLEVTASQGPVPLVVPLVVFVIVARPWRTAGKAKRRHAQRT